jgi:hypothetical protein
MEMPPCAYGREFLVEFGKFLLHTSAAWNHWIAAFGPEPTCQLSQQNAQLALMRMDVLTGYVGDEFSVSEFFAVENDATLRLLGPSAVPFGAGKQAEFQRHVESRQLRPGIRLGARNVVDAVATLSNDLANLLQSILGTVVGFESAAGPKTGPQDHENQARKNPHIPHRRGS